MSVLDAKLPAWQASTKAISPTKAEALKLEGKAPLSVDGGGLGNGRRVLLKDQTKAEQNGLWEVIKNEAFGGGGLFAGAGTFGGGSSWTLKRTIDSDSPEELAAGMLVPIEDGDVNQATSWIQRTEGAIEVGTTPLVFEALVAGARGNAGGSLEGLYAAPVVAENVIGTRELKPEAVTSSSLAPSAKQLSPQLTVAGTRKLAFGVVKVKMASGAKESEIKKVPHGLGVTPESVLLTPEKLAPEGNQIVPRVVTGATGAETFSVFFNSTTTFGATEEIPIYWLAIG